MMNKLIAIEGDAYICLTNNLEQISLCGSLTEIYLQNKPESLIIDMSKYDFFPDDSDLSKYNIIDYFELCEMKAYILSKNSILLRLYKKSDDEDDFIGYSIEYNELLKIAKDILIRYKNCIKILVKEQQI
jgi:hypothetical protein